MAYKTAFRILWQPNGYNCGVMAVINAINWQAGHNVIKSKDIKGFEKILKTTKEDGTEESPMLKELRKHLYARLEYKFSKRKVDNWLRRGNQVIVLYAYNVKTDDYHYANIFYIRKTFYWGANFCNLRGMCESMSMKSLVKRTRNQTSSVIYLRKKGR